LDPFLVHCLESSEAFPLHWILDKPGKEVIMNKREFERREHLRIRLLKAGFDDDEICAMVRISRTLSRWAERECNGEIERDETTGQPMAMHETARGHRCGYPVADREAGAIKRMNAIIAAHPGLAWYHQRDPRGCSVYVYRHDDVMPGVGVDCSYSSIGIAVH
jgi:hypothetical protein